MWKLIWTGRGEFFEIIHRNIWFFRQSSTACSLKWSMFENTNRFSKVTISIIQYFQTEYDNVYAKAIKGDNVSSMAKLHYPVANLNGFEVHLERFVTLPTQFTYRKFSCGLFITRVNLGTNWIALKGVGNIWSLIFREFISPHQIDVRCAYSSRGHALLALGRHRTENHEHGTCWGTVVGYCVTVFDFGSLRSIE